MSYELKTDGASADFIVLVCHCHYGALVLPDARIASRHEAVALARWILAGGDAGLTAERLGPKGTTHPSVGRPCSSCGRPFAAGDYTTLAQGVEVHWDCAGVGEAHL